MAPRFFREWMDDADPTIVRSAGREPLHPGWFSSHALNSDGSRRNAYAQLRAFQGQMLRGQMLLGAHDGRLHWTQADTHTLIVGASRSIKSSGLIVPLILSHPGPVVTTSSKLDTAIATGMVRGRYGTVWHFSPSEPCPPGFTELRWSPIVGAEDWDTALETGRRMAAVSDVDGSGKTKSNDNGTTTHFKSRAGLLLGVLLHYAATYGKDMGFVVDLVGRMDIVGLLKAAEQLAKDGRTQVAGFALGIKKTEDRERSGIFSTASVALGAYLRQDALRSAREPNFDIDAFVACPKWGDTVYITCPPGAGTAPLVVALLGQIQRAVYRNHRKQAMAGNYHHPVVHFVLDELATIAPLPDLDTLLAVGGEGLIVSGAIQDLSQARARWGDLAAGFFTLWQNVLVARGILDRETVELLSLMGGDFDRVMYSESKAVNERGDVTTTHTPHFTRERRLPPDVVMKGHPYDPDMVLMKLPSGHWTWLKLLPYYRSEPWLMILLATAWEVVTNGEPAASLPMPDLDRVTTAYLQGLGGKHAVRWAQARRRHGRRSLPW